MFHRECLEVPLLKEKVSLAFPRDSEKVPHFSKKSSRVRGAPFGFHVKSCVLEAVPISPVSRFAFSVTVYLSVEALQ